jgi:hypothetical protein
MRHERAIYHKNSVKRTPPDVWNQLGWHAGAL